MYVQRNIQARSCNHCCGGNARSITYFDCVSAALVTQHAKCMRRVMLPSVVCLALPHFSTLSQKCSQKNKVTECVFRFPPKFSSATFLILKTTERYTIINVYLSSCKVTVIPLPKNDLQIRRAVSPLKIKIPSKNMREKPTNTPIIIHSVY
jgi:hypothetical protein